MSLVPMIPRAWVAGASPSPNAEMSVTGWDQWEVGYEIDLQSTYLPNTSITVPYDRLFYFHEHGDVTRPVQGMAINQVSITYMAHECTTVLVSVWGDSGRLMPNLIIRGTVPHACIVKPIKLQWMAGVHITINSTGTGLLELQVLGERVG